MGLKVEILIQHQHDGTPNSPVSIDVHFTSLPNDGTCKHEMLVYNVLKAALDCHAKQGGIILLNKETREKMGIVEPVVFGLNFQKVEISELPKENIITPGNDTVN